MDCSIYIRRATDGSIGRIDLEDVPEDMDVWTALERMPRAWEALDEECVLGANLDGYEADVEEIFDEDDDLALAGWLEEVVVKVVEFDKGTGLPLRVLKVFRGPKDLQASRARDWACEWVEGSGKDTSLLDVRVMVGDSLEWRWEEDDE